MLQKAISSQFLDIDFIKSSISDMVLTVVTGYDFVPGFVFAACFSFSNFS